MNRWDIYWADVPFEDDPRRSKRRPVIIASDREAYVLTLKVTSKDARDETDYPLSRWREAGLTEPSVVRVRKISQLGKDRFGGRIGRVHDEDIFEIRRIMSAIKRNR